MRALYAAGLLLAAAAAQGETLVRDCLPSTDCSSYTYQRPANVKNAYVNGSPNRVVAAASVKATDRVYACPSDPAVAPGSSTACKTVFADNSRWVLASVVSLPPAAAPPTLGSTWLRWDAPTTNSDGTPLTNLAGFRVYYGRSPTTLTQVLALTNPGLRAVEVQNLAWGAWYFEMTALNTAGAESERSPRVTTTLAEPPPPPPARPAPVSNMATSPTKPPP